MRKFFTHKGDKTIWVIYLILSLASIVLIYSASSYIAVKMRDGNFLYFLFKQIAIIGAGYITMLLFSKIRYQNFQWLSKLFIFVVIPILLFTAILGTNINNASRWLTIPIIGISFQSSDFAKIVLLAFLARNISKLNGQQNNGTSIYYTAGAIFLPALVVTVLILKSNLSTALLVFTSAFFMMWLGQVKTRYLVGLAGIGILFVMLAFVVAKTNPNLLPRFDTWVSRIENFGGDDKDANYQVLQAKIAIASNPIIGKLPGKSSQRAFLPSAHADFIYAIIIEEYGTIIGFIGILIYLALLWRAMVIAKNSETKFGALLAMGLMFSIVFQALINIGVATNLLPVTGQPLPLISSGGTSFVFTSMALGIIQSISVGLKKEKEPIEVVQ
ncbi:MULTISPECIES: FtsW/RodA/SpoVE family cell cycle protein [unclassified Lentimicrobium]|uniref:FtsW/RodA/SpoVE family cell cycle protein n=1 Tax=unclassified Lentimicrobium TaxID=2677434 RepID=UPI001551B6F1|nr:MULTISPECIES: FtsW/RodA/SpoVE family cell cycle protein [unclassified Lentimicrobium]NPD44320.1 FtsW/RodA/SpoVE family cell cycle protein [Lentimicrobium sp. S6]NPD84575.1 FtsW/RodA/SpoVE family cell cycle protein [Lentimicrobium sp. L6]